MRLSENLYSERIRRGLSHIYDAKGREIGTLRRDQHHNVSCSHGVYSVQIAGLNRTFSTLKAARQAAREMAERRTLATRSNHDSQNVKE